MTSISLLRQAQIPVQTDNNSEASTIPVALTESENSSEPWLRKLNLNYPFDRSPRFSHNVPDKAVPATLRPPPPPLAAVQPPLPAVLQPEPSLMQLQSMEVKYIKPVKPSTPATLKRRSVGLRHSVGRTIRSLGEGCGNCGLALLLIILCLLPDGMFALYTYYFSYAEIYFNSKTSINIFLNSTSEGAFKFFFWFVAIICLIPNGLAGFGIMAVGYAISDGANGCLRFFWMIPWFAIFLGLNTITLWIRPVITPAWKANVFNHGCAQSDYSAILASDNFNNFQQKIPLVGYANVSVTITGQNFTTELTRQEDNHLRYDFHLTSTAGNFDNSLYSLITYDTQNQTYTAIAEGNSSTMFNVTGNYTITPTLSFPQLGLTTRDPGIPFTRPGYGGCWPAAASLVTNTSTPVTILNSLALNPHDDAQLRVCGMSGTNGVGDFQIALGVVFLTHYDYALCSTSPNGQTIGQHCDPDVNCNYYHNN
jgi:hypothetical protein